MDITSLQTPLQRIAAGEDLFGAKRAESYWEHRAHEAEARFWAKCKQLEWLKSELGVIRSMLNDAQELNEHLLMELGRRDAVQPVTPIISLNLGRRDELCIAVEQAR